MFLILLACTPTPTPEPAEDLVATARTQGPYEVGHQTTVVSTPQLVTGDTRALPVEIWFPAEVAGNSGTAYTVAGLASVPSPYATEGATPLAGPLPVAVYSHGSGGVGALGYPYAERLASHGWLVVAPDHLGNTTLDLIGSGDSFARSALDRPLDIKAVLDAVEAGLEGFDADASQVLLFGHSFGGYTSFASAGVPLDLDTIGPSCPPDSTADDCVLLRDPAVAEAIANDAFADPRIAAIVPQAPAVFGFETNGIADLDVPVLLMSSGGDRTTPDSSNARPAWQELDGPDDRWLQMSDGGHHTFITTCVVVDIAVIETFLSNVRQDGCGPDSIDISEAVDAMSAHLLAWGQWHVLGEPAWSEVIEADLHPGITVRSKQ